MSEKVVTFERARRRPDPARVAEFAETARRLQREREESADVVARVLRETPPEEWPRLATRTDLRNSGALNRLEAEVSALLEKEPRHALLLSDLAASIAETLPPDSYPAVVLAQLRAHAWKDRAQALAYIGRYPEALEALDRAEQQLAFGSLTHDRAIVRYVRALTLQKVNRFEESRELLAECSGVFRDHGDDRRYLYCGIGEALLLDRTERYREAYDTLIPLLEVARNSGDVESEARIQSNLAHAAVYLGDLQAANIHLSEAIARFVDLGKRVEAIRTELAGGRLLLARGQMRLGIQRLYEARRSFLMHDMVEEAGLSGLEIVEALLQNGSTKDAARLAKEILIEFRHKAFNDRALSALAYLSDAAHASRASAATARYVRGFIDSLRENPTREFVAL